MKQKKKRQKTRQDTKAKLVAIKNALSFVRFYCFLFEEYGD